MECEIDIANVARKSLVASCDIKAGSVLSEDLITIKRPGTGLLPKEKVNIIGRKVKNDIKKDSIITLEMLE